VICDNLKEIQPELHAEIYKGQVAWKALQEHYTGMGEGVEKESVSNLLADLATAVVDLQQVDNMNLQTRYGGGLIIRNSYNVQRIIRSTSTLIGAVANALALRVAAAQQLQTMEAAQAIQRAIGRTMEDTAEQVGKAMVKSAEMSQEMVRNVESLQRSCDHFDLAAQALAAVCDETIKIAGQASNALGSMNERLQVRASAVEARRRQ
jgi:uncharacterized protein YaaN involved in tellurite resistance